MVVLFSCYMAKQGGGSELDAGNQMFGPDENIKNSPSETLAKLALGIGNLDSAAKALKGLTTNLQTVMPQLEPSIDILSKAFPKSNVFGNMFGEEKKLNTHASPEEIVGDLSTHNQEQNSNNNHQESSHGSEQHNKNQQQYDPHSDPNLSEAGDKILNNDSKNFEHHNHLPQIQPQLTGTSVQEHDRSGRGH